MGTFLPLWWVTLTILVKARFDRSWWPSQCVFGAGGNAWPDVDALQRIVSSLRCRRAYSGSSQGLTQTTLHPADQHCLRSDRAAVHALRDAS